MSKFVVSIKKLGKSDILNLALKECELNQKFQNKTDMKKGLYYGKTCDDFGYPLYRF